MSTPVVVGIDASPRMMGWGACLDIDGASVACGAIDHDGAPESVGRCIHDIDRALGLRSYEPTMVVLEEVFPPNRGMLAQAQRHLGHVEAHLRATWPWCPIVPMSAPEWRQKTGVEGRGRSELKLAALDMAKALGWRCGDSHDAAEGALLALAGYVALERGEAVRVGREGA